jgi:hypothetical protein
MTRRRGYNGSSCSRATVAVDCPRVLANDDDCEGTISVTIEDERGQCSGPPEKCYPPYTEIEIGDCDSCGADDWTEAETEAIEETARAIADDAGEPPEPEDRDDDE